MPIAEFQCLDCRHMFEQLVKIIDPLADLPFCPHCGAQAELVPSRPAPPVFKGAKWNS